MDRFIRRQNVEHYRHLLETVTDEKERECILKLLERRTAKAMGRWRYRLIVALARYSSGLGIDQVDARAHQAGYWFEPLGFASVGSSATQP
jgi:hypothetical protein